MRTLPAFAQGRGLERAEFPVDLNELREFCRREPLHGRQRWPIPGIRCGFL